MIEAEVICDSISEQQRHRLTTFKLRYPKFIHGEFMTHRVLSRNASSSRAVPTKKLLEEVRSDHLRAGPVFWGRNQPGMQAAEELSDVDPNFSRSMAKEAWKQAALSACRYAQHLVEEGAHKQIVNRLLEPFSHINVVATATEWQNFFGLRLHKDAQPEMRRLAVTMWEALKTSKPKLLKPGQWHLPFVDEETKDEAFFHDQQWKISSGVKLIKVSVARCARVSYESFESGKRSTVEEDLKLYERLLGDQPLHASPAEHQATPDELVEARYENNSVNLIWADRGQWGNFVGWRQYRKMILGEAVAPLPEGYG